VAGAIRWLLEEEGIDPGRIGALGLSMGAEVAITAAAADERISAVVAEGVSARVPEDLAYLPDDASGMIQRLDGQLMWAAAAVMTDAPRPPPLTEAIADATRVPVLLIVGSAPDEMAAAPLLQRAAPSLDAWLLPDTPHIQGLDLHPRDWEARVIEFLDAALGIRSVSAPVETASGPGVEPSIAAPEWSQPARAIAQPSLKG
jgi:acetyl esterase/lipase